MLKLNLFIQACGFIGQCGNSHAGVGQLNAELIEPDYQAYLSVMQMRRMSKAVRMGVGAAKMCMANAPDVTVSAIQVGTALGCLNDTEFFLKKMVEQDEQMLTPTSFIQSTHNTVAGQVALQMGCHGHNLTFVHRAQSFGHALVDAQLYLNYNPNAHVLVGAVDERTALSAKLTARLGSNLSAEGAAFFLLSSIRNNHTLAHLQSVSFDDVPDNISASGYQPISSIELYNQCGEFPTADAMGLAISLLQASGRFSQQHNYCGHHSTMVWEKY